MSCFLFFFCSIERQFYLPTYSGGFSILPCNGLLGGGLSLFEAEITISLKSNSISWTSSAFNLRSHVVLVKIFYTVDTLLGYIKSFCIY